MLKVKDDKGEIYTMPSNTPKCILEVHYSTSYYQFVVQDHIVDEDGNESFPTKNIIVPLKTNNWIDFIALKDDEIGTLFNTHFENVAKEWKWVFHKLKIQPKYFNEVCTGKKSFEIRKNDREFKVGDTLLLQEFIPETQGFTGKVVERRVTYITDYAQQENYVVMAIT